MADRSAPVQLPMDDRYWSHLRRRTGVYPRQQWVRVASGVRACLTKEAVMRKRTIKGRRRARRGLHRTPPAARIKSALRRRTDRSALEIASGRPAVPPAVPALLAGGGIGAL